MTLLELVQAFAARTGIPVPSYVVSNSDPQVVQLLNLVHEVTEDLWSRNTWSISTQEATFTTVAGEDQGAIDTLAPNGFKFILRETIYNRTLRLPVYGPILPSKWQALKALPNAGPFYKYRIVRGRLLFNPPAAADHTCAFEYASSHLILAADGTTTKAYANADTDNFLLDDSLFLAALRWKWKYEKGLDYAEDFRRYEEMVNNAKSRDASAPTLSMDGVSDQFSPGIFVPYGNWNGMS